MAGKSKFTKNLQRNFITGLIVLIPLIATILVMKWLFDAIDGILAPAFEPVFGRPIPGIGVVAILILIYLAGLLTTNIIGRRLIRFGQSLVEKIPIAKQIYSAFSQTLDSLIMSQKGAFKEVVLVEFPRAGMRSVAFVTSKMTDASGQELLNLFIPTAPNPTSGFLEIVSPDSVIKTNISVEDAMKIVLSAGMVCPPSIDLGPPRQEETR